MSGSRGGFVVTIKAVDAATKQIDAVNARIRAMQTPAERVQKSLGRLADTTGITALGNGMRNLARESLRAFETIGRIGGPLGAITGAASIAGLARMTAEFATMGSQLGFTGARTGVAVDRLHALQGAAKLSGSSAESLTSGLVSLKDAIFDINAGRAAPMTIAAFNTLKIATREANGQLRSAADVLPELADRIAAIKDPTQQATLATLTLGGAGEELLPFLRRGSAGIADYTAKARQYGVVNKAGADAANTLREKQVELGLATQGLGLAISEKLAPVLGPMLTDLAKWVSDNRDIIATDITGWVEKTVPSIKTFASDVDSVAQKVGGWKTVIEGVIGLALAGWAGRILLSLNPLTMALAGILLTIQKISTFEERSAPKNLPVGSPLWGNVPEDEQPNYVNSPRSQAFLHPNGTSLFSQWWNRPTQHSALPSVPLSGPDRLGGQLPNDIEREIRQKSRAMGLDEEHMVRLARAERGGYDRVSPRGAMGPMQLMPGTAADEHVDPLDWHQNISGGLSYYKKQLDRFHGNYQVGDAAYNAGPNSLAVNRFAQTGDPSGLPKETRDYVAGINGGTGSGTPAAAPTTTVRGSADLKIKLDGFPMGTKTQASTSGDLFSGAPKIEMAMPMVGP